MIKQAAKVLFLFILAVNISACERNKCKDVTCPGVLLPGYSSVVAEECYGGVCLCPDGYEGADCQTTSYLKYVGNYYGYENCQGAYSGAPNPYQCYIFSAAGQYAINYIGISSFLGQGTVYAEILNTDPSNLGTTVFIPSQTLGGITIYNSYGTYFGPGQGGGTQTRIVINLNYNSLNGNFQCQETLYLQ